MEYQIRLFTPDDYDAVCAMWNTVYPDLPGTPEEWHFGDTHRDPKCQWQRWVIEVDGRIVAAGHYSQPSNMYHPQKFDMDLSVLPEYQGRGLGKALYQQIMAALQPFDPLSVMAGAREDRARGVRFLTDRGFQEVMRDWESHLAVAGFASTPYAGLEAQIQAQGITIQTFAELAADPNRDAKLHALDHALLQNVPLPEPPTLIPYEYFVESVIHNPNLLPDAFFIAVHDGEYVGQSTLWAYPAVPTLLNTGLTGVRAAYRRRGIALALKLRAIAYAQAHGYSTVKTWNESNNRPMLAINERLGFVRRPAWITFTRSYTLDV